MAAPLPPGTSLDDVLQLVQSQNPALMGMVLARTEAQFVEAAEKALERCIRQIESGAKAYRVLDEQGLSKLLTDLLTMSGFSAAAEDYHNGHVDVTICHFAPSTYRYLGECKIYAGFEYHYKGCQQVLGYCSGRDRRAFTLDFFKQGGMYEKLQKIRERFEQDAALSLLGQIQDHFIKGSFVTTHPHSSGCNLEILHVGCYVWRSP